MNAFRVRNLRLADGKTVQLLPENRVDDDSKNWFTVIVGRNGLGKSRLLGSLVAMLGQGDSLSLGQRRKLFVDSIQFDNLSQSYQVQSTSRGVLASSVHQGLESGGPIAWPTRVIATSATLADKFPISSRYGRETYAGSSRYRYMGIGGNSGRASAAGLAYRALDGLFNAIAESDTKRIQVAKVFDFLDYEPVVGATYAWRHSIVRHGPEALRDYVLQEADAPRRPYGSSGLSRDLESGAIDLNKVWEMVNGVLQRSERESRVEVVADFRASDQSNQEHFWEVQQLQKLGLLRTRSIDLRRKGSDQSSDLREASSGEISIVSTFLGLASVMEDNSLVAIDEPEVGLHPAWQENYLELLANTFKDYSGCHFLIATHSPLIVADISPSSGNIVSMEEGRRFAEPGADYAGESADEVLVEAFGVAGKGNLYVKEVLGHVLELVSTGRVESADFETALLRLESVSASLDLDNPIRDIIADLKRVRGLL